MTSDNILNNLQLKHYMCWH